MTENGLMWGEKPTHRNWMHSWICLNQEGFMLSEISQGEKGTLCYHLFVKCESEVA